MPAKDFIEKHVKAFNDHDAAAWASHYTADAVLVDPQYPEPVRGREGIQKDIEAFFAAFPDMRFQVTGSVAEGDVAAIHGTGSGTHRGPMEGPAGTIEATNKPVSVAYAAFFSTNAAGLIVEERRFYDMAGMMMQLGLMPA